MRTIPLAARGSRATDGVDVASAPPPLTPPPPGDAELDFLGGGGEMGARIRAYDWSATPLGAPVDWPRSLRHSLQVVLAASQPMSVAWGDEPLYLCNDACARLFGADGQGSDVGPPGHEVWPYLREPTLGALLERVRAHGGAVVADDHLVCVVRGGRAEEVYVTCRFESVPDATGAAAGVLLTLTDTTDRVVNARRTAALRGLAAEAARARSVEEACACVTTELARHPADVPFALLYARDGASGVARLVGTAGVPEGSPASPTRLALTASADAHGWPVREALVRDQVLTVVDLVRRFGPLPGGDWPLAPRTALVAPLTPPGCEGPEAVLIVGVSARRALDSEYRGFIELVARQVTAAMAAGRTFEEQRRHAEATAAAAKRARVRRRARERALEARFAGVLEERTRMAREIHDTLLQGATGMALQLRAALARVQRTPGRAVELLEQLVALAEATSHDARRAVWDMRGPSLSEGGIPAALRSAARRAVGTEGARVDVEERGAPRALSPAIQDAVLHVGQEALVNAAKHAAARRIVVRVSYTSREIRLAVVDDGRGFRVDPEYRAYGGHWGLVGMRERAERVGATLTVTSAPGTGTTVDLVVPTSTRRRGAAA